jgi:hypothetical protein
MKNKETLEEFAERMAVKENKSSLFELAKKYIVLGAKWQAEQERMYSEEDILTSIELAMIQGLTIGQYRDLLIEQLKKK